MLAGGRNDLADQIGRVVRCENDDDVGDFPDLRRTPEGLATCELLQQRLRRGLAQMIVKCDRRRHCVDADAEVGRFQRAAARQRHHAALRWPD